jgi:hypothetical protein
MATKIPYEKQIWNDENQRSCAAAALSMVYQSFGMSVDQKLIWQSVSTPSPTGGFYAQNYRLAADAQARGLFAVAVQARDPVGTTKLLLSKCIPVVMNYRVTKGSNRGHFTVAVSSGTDGITFHDPESGPNKFLTNSDLRELWTKTPGNCEISGDMIVAISNVAMPVVCDACSKPVGSQTNCKSCGAAYGLQPGQALNCGDISCSSRLWRSLLCPSCDRLQHEL